MNNYTVYRIKWQKSKGEDSFIPHMAPLITLTAPSPEDALRIAKQKGFVAPIVGLSSQRH